MLAKARDRCLKLALLLLVVPAITAAAQDAPTTATAAPAAVIEQPAPLEEQLRELDEIVVRGERLAVVIVEAENEFFKLYNQLNKDDKYDVNCPYLNLSADSGSRINSRVCLPGFVATAIADWTTYKISCEPEFANFDANRDGRVSRFEAAVNPDLDFQFEGLDQNGDGSLSEFQEFEAFETWALMNLNCYRPPPPELVLMEGSDAWYRHMLQVTDSDPRLREMASHLDDLHLERSLVQREYLRFEATGEPREVPAALRGAGPRPR
jgi:hypothetical protein